ncbi:MAG: HD domain-containing protein, partial [Gammaproteobacteria bacterium]|nr:HD domain-containing protein [Gammaproteobacteria bacterium]
HASQRRKGTEIPYVSHLLAVASLVLEAGGTEDEAIAALLHDGPEDQGGLPTLKEIRDRFGVPVGRIVAACSDTFDVKKPAWQARKETYLAHLREAAPSVLLVSCADKLHNARAILADYRRYGEALWSRFNARRDEILWYYGELARFFATQGPDQLAGELALVVKQLNDEVARSAA